MLTGYYPVRNYPEHLRRIKFRDPESDKMLVFLTNNTASPALTICGLYKSRWQVELFFKWIKQHLRIKHFPWQPRERREDVGEVRRCHLRAHRHRQEGTSNRGLDVHMSTDLVGVGFRENPAFMRLPGR